MSQINTLKLDLPDTEDFNKLQRELYLPSRDEEISSRYSYQLEKKSAGAHMKIKMEVTGSDKEIVYRVASNKFDTLFKCEMITELLPIKVKEECKRRVSICYPHNLGHHIINKGELRIDDDPYQGIDSTTLDIYSQWYETKTDLYNEMIGNIPCLEEWTTELPGYPVTTPQPWLFSRKSNTSLIMLRAGNKITFTFERKVKLTELLKMRVKVKAAGEDNYFYKEIPCNLDYLDIKSENIPVPEMWGRYSQMTEAEREWRKTEAIKQEIWYDDSLIISSDNPAPLGSKIIIPLHSKTLVRHIFWMAQNVKSIENREYSNYTTNISDFRTGFSPCSKIGLKYGGSERVKELPYYHFTRSEAYDFFPKAPYEPGYHVKTFGHDPTYINADTSVDLNTLNAKLIIDLGDTDIFKAMEDLEVKLDEEGQIIPREAWADESINVNNELYTIHVRLFVYKKLEMSWEEGKLVYKVRDDANM